MNNPVLFWADRGTVVRATLDWAEHYAEQETGPRDVAIRRERNLLLSALNQLPVIAIAQGYAVEPSTTALAFAVEFVKNLPSNRVWPKVAPDEEGNVLLVWGGPPPRCAITLEGSTLHVVENPGSNSTHLDPIIYNGGHIPPRVLACIPTT
jgi:hypothetical protein